MEVISQLKSFISVNIKILLWFCNFKLLWPLYKPYWLLFFRLLMIIMNEFCSPESNWLLSRQKKESRVEFINIDVWVREKDIILGGRIHFMDVLPFRIFQCVYLSPCLLIWQLEIDYYVLVHRVDDDFWQAKAFLNSSWHTSVDEHTTPNRRSMFIAHYPSTEPSLK